MENLKRDSFGKDKMHLIAVMTLETNIVLDAYYDPASTRTTCMRSGVLSIYALTKDRAQGPEAIASPAVREMHLAANI